MHLELVTGAERSYAHSYFFLKKNRWGGGRGFEDSSVALFLLYKP